MGKPERVVLRDYALADNDAEGALEALIVLADGLRGAKVMLSRPENPEHAPVQLPSSIMMAMVDLVGLLISKGAGRLLVIDGNEEIGLVLAARLARRDTETIKSMIERGELEHRMDGNVYRIRIDSILPHLVDKATASMGEIAKVTDGQMEADRHPK